jgi:negative regulator of flagellin synthesis FlgM
MKINDANRALQSTDAGATSKAGGKAPATKTTNTTTTAGSVKISDASRSLLTAGVSHSEAPFDAKRVDAIKAAISSGHFKVNPEAVADKVLSSASQLLVGK